MAGVGKYFQTTSLRANCSINHWPLKPVSPGHRENGAGRRQVPGTRWPVLGGLCRLERTGHRTPRTLWGTTEVCILDVCSAKDTLQLLSRPQARPSLICTALNVTHTPATSARPQTQESPRPMASPLGEHQGAPLHKQGGCSLHLHLLAPATPPHSSLCTTWDSLGAPPPSQLVICVHQPCPLNSTPAPCAKQAPNVVQGDRRRPGLSAAEVRVDNRRCVGVWYRAGGLLSASGSTCPLRVTGTISSGEGQGCAHQGARGSPSVPRGRIVMPSETSP